MTLLIMGTVRIPNGALDAARPAMVAMLAASRAEDGCLAYSYAQDVLDPRVIHVSERWRDRAALDAHFTTPHMAAWRAQFATLGITDRDLTLYESDDGAPI
ncbi:MAG: antibiotic biosynthesis monooxygenase [Sphingomonas sp.]|uniref:putative quinol monooxygenase n=1 Tax=Sphingomonas sp. TaxID=28214 RepID=UPI001AC4D480|nr:putative quinol monooxygenase [Sphingomonas sp.]MBN8807162.1 antibiotic biosynthesis monooxygenase [Sphingomonas sp.]